jgi:clan AA aspartic protease
MISGKVNSQREAIVSVSLFDAGGAEQPIDAVLDTGFTGELTLPAKLIDDLRLEFFGSRSAVLGDGSEVIMDNYFGEIMWHGRVKRIVVLETEGGPLVGMELLEGSDLSLRIEPDGPVLVEEIEKAR